MDRIRANIRINGIVQGVGFRPFLHRQMLKYELAGWIRNTCDGVEIEAEGEDESLRIFLDELESAAPELARIESVRAERCRELRGHRDISILPSLAADRPGTLVSPDVAVCPDCLRELFDPEDRRYRYPFINCTNCGPRFSIMRGLPYDRARTAMAPFAMCPDCAAEYEDIANRRYHAQPDCCGICGPELFFLDECGNRLPGDPIALAAERLNRGGIIAVKGLGGIHLSCRADDPAAVGELRRRKHRDEKPLALMCRDMEAAGRYCIVSPDEEALLTGHARPIVLLKKKDPGALSHLSENKYLGVMLPYAPVHHLLFQSSPDALVMTSANLSDLPIVIDNDDAIARLRGVADGFLLNNRDIVNRCDDSLMRIVRGREYPLRRSRGYAPLPLRISAASGATLACGAEQKASFCLAKGDQAFLSAHIGDLKNAETLLHYEKQIALFERMFDIRPRMIVCDLHPDYLSADYARSLSRREGVPLLAAQHHHAHMAACMADNGLDGLCIGVIWDGTGYGPDGTSWGGEFLAGGYADFTRMGSIRPMMLPGGNRAVKEIWRTGVSLMLDAGLDPANLFPGEHAARIARLIDADLNCPRSSGMGRLFDGVCAIAGICQGAGYEGQGAVLLEAAAEEDWASSYPFEITEENGMHIFDCRRMIAAVCRDRRSGVSPGRIAAGFMNTLVLMAREICARIRRDCGLNRIVLSGGVFQNMYLLGRLMDGLEQDGFEVYRHSRVSTNDEGISFGQLAIAERRGGTYVPSGTAEDHRN